MNTTTGLISAGELKVGQYVTVLNWKPKEILTEQSTEEYVDKNPMEQMLSKVMNLSQDRSLCGDVLAIEAIDLPFIVVQRLNSPVAKGSIDTRFCVLKELSKDYVNVYIHRGA